MTILNIETSTSVCSVAVTIDGISVASREKLFEVNHASDVSVFIEQLLFEVRTNGWHLDAVALSRGPGSYTGLRIGSSIAKGICYGLKIPLIQVDTLQVLCASIPSQQLPIGVTLCPMLDARRMEVYTALYELDETGAIRPLSDVEAKIIDADSYADIIQSKPICFFGNGAMKCKDIITAKNALFIDDVVPLAKYMGPLAESQTSLLNVKEMAYYEPFYLKDFVAAPSHIKGLK